MEVKSNCFSVDEICAFRLTVVREGAAAGSVVKFDKATMAKQGWEACLPTVEIVGQVRANMTYLIEAAPQLLEIIVRQAGLVMQMRGAIEVYIARLKQLSISTEFPESMELILRDMEAQLLAAIRGVQVGAETVVKEILAEDLTSKNT